VNQGRSSLLVVLVLIGVLVGIIGGALMGGVAGFYVARQNMQALPTAVQAQPISSTTQTTAPAVTNLTLKSDSAVIDAVKKVEPAVVTVVNDLSTTTNPFRRGGVTPQASGSGVIVDKAGYVVTNFHVIDGAKRIQVIFSNGKTVDAKVIGGDPIMDLAVIQVDNAPAVAGYGDSNAVQLGETAIAIGSPLGNYRGSVTVGVISGVQRRVGSVDDLIQTDAAINHGNSGGPLLNAEGQIIGITTLIVRDASSGDVAEGLGFAIPSNTVKFAVEQLVSKGKVEYPFIGISYTDATDAGNGVTANGVLVSCVSNGTPGSAAGVQANDVVTAINGDKIDETHTLRSLLFKYKPGDTVTLTVLRGGQTLSLQLKLVTRPTNPPACTG
jgi:2-alkenal reductase